MTENVYRFLCIPIDEDEDVTKFFQWMECQWRSNNCLIYCMTPQQYYDSFHTEKDPPKNVSNSLWEEQCRSILQYIKPRDQYMALLSLLLKSRAFFQTVGDETESVGAASETLRPIVVLPRTRYNQPFIPPRLSSSFGSTDAVPPEQNVAVPFSISHQYPMVGMVQQVSSSFDATSRYCGLDIVMFDPYNDSLYSNTMDFIAVFQDLFSPKEWNCILECSPTEKDETPTSHGTSSDDLLLREFYIRWSMKEAYTKAFGMGMNFNFASFETVRIIPEKSIHVNDSNRHSIRSVYQWINTSRNFELQSRVSLCAIGTVTQVSNAAPTNHTSPVLHRPDAEDFWFFFYPFHERSTSTSVTTNEAALADSKQAEIHASDGIIGCACICVGPRISMNCASVDSNAAIPSIQVEWTSLQELVAFHMSGL